MYILKRIFNLTSYSSFLHKNFVKILLLYENPSIRQFFANNAFQNLQYQRKVGYLKKLGINCGPRKFCAQDTVRLFDEIHIIQQKICKCW